MGSLSSCDGMGLFIGWILKPRIPNKPGRSRSNVVGGWNALAASSKYGLGLFASGAQVQLLQFLSSGLDVHEQRKQTNRAEGRGHHYSKQHGDSWLQSPLPGNGGGMGALSNWSLGMLLSRPWGSWYMGQGSSKNGSSSGNVTVASSLGGGNERSPSEPSDKRYPSRTLTNLILGLNIIIFGVQIASKGQLLLWGAKVNGLINQGQVWRLLTPCVLHANIFHLLVNAYSLNSIGPTVESLAGPKRFLAVYSASALTSTTLSYYCCSAPSVGASGAIFGLVGALAVFLVRHKNMMVGGQKSLQQVTRVIAINLVLGLVSDGIDNWSHFGGLVGGAAVAWLLGPVYTFEIPLGGGQKQLVDRPPISYLLPSQVRRDL